MQATNIHVPVSITDQVLPAFPHFRTLQLHDKSLIDQFLHNFQPYSDYNFASLFSYSVNDEIEISQLHGNLVVNFLDYLTHEPFYSFIGMSNVIETTKTLLSFSSGTSIYSELKLIPEEMIERNPLLHQEFRIVPDRDNFDYIYSTEEQSKLYGQKYNSQRNRIKRFKKSYPDYQIMLLDLKKSQLQNEIQTVFFEWEKQKGANREDTIHELSALHRFFSVAPQLHLLAFGIYYHEKLIGFSLDEIINDHYAISHFEKADTRYTGVFQVINQASCEYLFEHHYSFINWEQDLGIPGLRDAKELWRPVKYLKKYIISRK